ncbi:MAG: hypothetical protein KGM98_10985 [Bacteroidota bacterium]|nr:hypothetical protein [Bacteroidota bacterium]
MRKISLLLLVVLFSGAAVGQLAHTDWKGTFQAPDSVELVLHFKADTLLVNTPDSQTIEIMQFSVHNDTLALRKIAGQSDCMDNSDALYQFELKEDSLFIKVLRDDCDQRASAWPLKGLTRL